MANIYEIIFVLQLLIFISVFLVKIYNLMCVAKFYDIQKAILFFILAMLAYGVGLVTTLLGHDEWLFSILLQLETWFIVLIVALFLGELFLYLSNWGSQIVEPHKPMKDGFGDY